MWFIPFLICIFIMYISEKNFKGFKVLRLKRLMPYKVTRERTVPINPAQQ